MANVPTQPDNRSRHRLAVIALVIGLVAVLAFPGASGAQTGPGSEGDWETDTTFEVAFLGREGPEGPDRYRITFDYGATFFGIAVTTMPLVPAEQAVALLQEAYRAAFPGRPLEHVQPDDAFDIQVPLGTIVSTQWREKPGVIEYLSLRGDALELFTSPRSLVLYRLVRTENPTRAEVVLNPAAEPTAIDLAKAVYAPGDPGFTPDVLQVARTRKALREGQTSIMVDLTKPYLDDFPLIRGQADLAGKTEGGLDIYRFRTDQAAQPLFRVDDGIGQVTDPAALPTVMRIYFYKDGTIRLYRRAESTVLVSDRNPRNDEWAKVYAEYGRLDPLPNRWEIGQPQEDASAQELKDLGIVVLRYQPSPPPGGNFITQFFDWLMSLMDRKS